MVCINHLTVRAGRFEIKDISMEIPEGKCAVLQGESGSGKSMIMEAICGIPHVLKGGVTINSKDVTELALAERNVGYVPQDNVLFKTMSVREQLAYGPKLRKWAKPDILYRVDELAGWLQIDHLLDRMPRGLSGGESKRVVIGRALASRPDILCLDECFSGLDDKTRKSVMRIVRDVIRQEGVTTLLITHQQEEAEFMGDVRYLLENGNLTRDHSFTG